MKGLFFSLSRNDLPIIFKREKIVNIFLLFLPEIVPYSFLLFILNSFFKHCLPCLLFSNNFHVILDGKILTLLSETHLCMHSSLSNLEAMKKIEIEFLEIKSSP